MTGLLWIAFSAVLLLIFRLWKRRSPVKLREIGALNRINRAVGLSVEEGTRLHIALGTNNLITGNSGSSLASLAMLRYLSERTSVGDQPPIATAGDMALALLSQDTLQAGYQSAAAPELFEPTTGRLAGLSPFGYAAGTLPMIQDEGVSTVIVMGHFGPEAALIADTAERGHTAVLGASDDPAAQSVLFATAHEPLIGEELFASAAYLGAGPFHAASLSVQDVLRWLVILGMLAGAAAKLIGAI